MCTYFWVDLSLKCSAIVVVAVVVVFEGVRTSLAEQVEVVVVELVGVVQPPARGSRGRCTS